VQWQVNWAFCFKTINHAGSKMLCVGGGSAIATTEDFVAVKQGLHQRHRGTGDRVRQGFRRGNLSLNAFCKAL
jgi:hypothetical protein